MTFSTVTLSIRIRHFAVSHFLILMVNVVMLSVAVLFVIMLNVVLLSVIATASAPYEPKKSVLSLNSAMTKQILRQGILTVGEGLIPLTSL
jgi:hypothetical protein